MIPPKQPPFYELVTQAVAYFSERGYTSQTALDLWVKKLREGAEKLLRSPQEAEKEVRKLLEITYKRTLDSAEKQRMTVPSFSVQKLKPAMRRDLERRIKASSQLIKLNRTEAIETTLRRFSGWATSVPVGGSGAVDKVAEKKAIRAPLVKMDFIERRVAIDQSAKFAASLNETIARGNNAIAVKWRSPWRRAGYNFREEHKERDGNIYLLSSSWAREKGLVKPAECGLYEDITRVGEEVYCQCTAEWIYSLAALPNDMLTAKALALIADAKLT